MLKKLSVLFSLVVLAILCTFSANAGFLVDENPYIEDAKTKIIDHVVYKLQKDTKGKKYYEVYDWFDTYEASETVKEINIVSEIDGIKVTAINTYGIDEYRSDGYWKNKNFSVKKVTIPDTITEIGYYFFSVLDGVEELTVPASVNTFRHSSKADTGELHTFTGMESLRKITFIGDLKELGGFKDCKKLETVVLKGSVEKIVADAFYNCVSLKNITIPEKVKDIGETAFYKTSLTSISIPVTALKNGVSSFADCKKLTKVVFKGENKSFTIAYGAFANCSVLKTVTFPKSCKNMTIEDRAFRNCKSLQSVKFPTTCKKLTIGNRVFGNCLSLKTVTFPKTADSVIIGYRAFRNCQKLSKVYNTTHIEKIYGGAFRNCLSLTSFTISDKTKLIGKNAFYTCKKLKTVTVNSKNSAAKIYKNAFYGTASGIKFTAKNKAVAKNWKSALKKSGIKNIKVYYSNNCYV